jgi:hypothetical protein
MDINLSAVELLELRALLLSSVLRLVTPMLFRLDHRKKGYSRKMTVNAYYV